MRKKILKEECFTAYENYVKFKFQGSKVKLYWNMATLISVCIIHGCCFHTAPAEPRSYTRERGIVKQEIFLPGPWQKKFADTCSKGQLGRKETEERIVGWLDGIGFFILVLKIPCHFHLFLTMTMWRLLCEPEHVHLRNSLQIVNLGL